MDVLLLIAGFVLLIYVISKLSKGGGTTGGPANPSDTYMPMDTGHATTGSDDGQHHHHHSGDCGHHHGGDTGGHHGGVDSGGHGGGFDGGGHSSH